MRIRTLIADDEPLARAGLRALLADDLDIELVGECGNGIEVIAAVEHLRPELLLLDVRMPGLDGLSALAALDQVPVTVLVTAHQEHGVRAFEVRAFDYVMKPVDETRFRTALQHAKEQVRRLRLAEVISAWSESDDPELPRRSLPSRHPARLALPDGSRTRLVSVADIDWIAAESYYSRVHIGSASYLLREALTTLEARLDPGSFFRVHRSAIVNLDRVREIRTTRRGSFAVVLATGTEVRLSRDRRARLQRWLDQRL